MKNWKESTLGDLCEMKRGPFGSALKKNFLVKKGKNTFKVYGQQNSIQNNFDIGDQYINSEKYEELKQFTLTSGDLILTTIGTIGRIAIVPENIEPGIINSMLIRFKLNNEVLPKFFTFLFDSKLTKFVRDNAYGNAVKQIPKSSELKKIKILLPPLETQKHIVSILERAEKLKEKRQITNDDTNKIIQSVFYEMFGDPVKNEKGWDLKELQKVLDVKGRVGWKGYKKTDLRKSGPLVLGATHITNYGEIDISKPVYLSKEKFEESPEIKIIKHDLIFAQRGSLGLVGLVTKNYAEATINPCVLILRPTNVNPFFMNALLNLDKVKKEIRNLNKSSSIPMIIQKDIKEFKLAFPPIELQNQFSEIVQKIELLKEKQKESSDDINILFDALMQKAFNGELVE